MGRRFIRSLCKAEVNFALQEAWKKIDELEARICELSKPQKATGTKPKKSAEPKTLEGAENGK